MTKRLTDRFCAALKPGEATHMDSAVPGFGIRVRPSGAKSYVLVARFPGSNNPTRKTISPHGALTLEAARKKARHWLDLLAQGIDPSEHERQEREAKALARENTFARVAEDFIRDKLSTERCGDDAAREIRRVFIPRWGKLPVTQVSEIMVANLIKEFRDRKYMARNLLTIIRRMLDWAIDQRAYGIEHNPCARLKPNSLAGKKEPRTRVLANDELRALWHATAATPYPYGPMYRMLVLTGARLSEVAEAKWSEIDLGRKLWTVPSERMKNNVAHVIPLSDDMVALLKSLPRFKSGEYVFSSAHGVRAVSAFSVQKRLLDAEMQAELGAAFKPYRIHDIRRSVRTHLSAIPNISDLVRELCIGHARPELHKIYDLHNYVDEKRYAFDAWSKRLRGIVAGADMSNVVPMPSATVA
jgi:integrase